MNKTLRSIAIVVFTMILLVTVFACSAASQVNTAPGTFCGNEYWPLKEGASWTYLDTNALHHFTMAVSNITGSGPGSTADLISTSDGSKIMTITCLDEGIQTKEDGLAGVIIMLPNGKDIKVGSSWPLNGLKSFKGLFADVRDTSSYTVPAGTFDTVHICVRAVEDGEKACTSGSYFAKGAGLVAFTNVRGTLFTLTEYHIP